MGPLKMSFSGASSICQWVVLVTLSAHSRYHGEVIRLSTDPIDPAELLAAVRHPHCGAVTLFLGTVRDITGPETTEFLEYEAYPAMAEKALSVVVNEAQERWPGVRLALAHRLGRLGVGEISVGIAAAAPHRAEAFEACRYVIERLKADVPIWKRDVAPDGATAWRHT